MPLPIFGNSVSQSRSGGAAEIGQEYGGDTGEAVAAIAAPLAGATLFPKIGRGIQAVAKDVYDNINPNAQGSLPASVLAKKAVTEEAERIIHEQAMRSGMTRDEIVQRYKDTGEVGTLADVNPTFAHAVRTVANNEPAFEGASTRQLQDRVEGQAERVGSSLEEVSGIKNRDVVNELNGIGS